MMNKDLNVMKSINISIYQSTCITYIYVMFCLNHTDNNFKNVITPQMFTNSLQDIAAASSSADLYRCDNGDYVRRTYVCDGYPHCRDQSDESYCGTPGFTNLISAFLYLIFNESGHSNWVSFPYM